MPKANFQKLRIYQLAEDLSDAVWELVRTWDLLARDTVGKQLIRAADSVGANIAEGAGRGTYRDNRQFVRTARGSLYETKHFLRRAFRRKLVTSSQVRLMRPLIDELGPKLNAYLRYLNESVQCSPNQKRISPVKDN